VKLVVLTSRFPYPLEKGDKLRIFNQIKELSKKHEITLITCSFFTVSAEDLRQLNQLCKSVYIFKINGLRQVINLCRAFFTGLPLQVGLFYSPTIKKKIHRLIAEKKPDAIYCHLIRMSEYVKQVEGIPKTLDYMDVFSKGMQRRAERSGFLMKQAALFEYKRLLFYEQAIFDSFQHQVIISEQDKSLIPHPERDRILVIENGVDLSVFYPMAAEKKFDLLFTGNMAYPPNIEAAIYAAKFILPELSKKRPGLKLLIAGIHPSASVRKLQADNVSVISEFSHIREAFAMSRINLAPMLTSIGLQNKILQAMAMKIPSICSSLANNAVKAMDGKSILVADTPEQFKNQILLLLDNPAVYAELAQESYRFVIAHYNWGSQNEKLEKLIFS
jgi:sugar transferase (PEP-CTERM/EpsH1 system associated)